jgi:2-oxoglutarate ferredoxin oxidoreductase subunit gamma
MQDKVLRLIIAGFGGQGILFSGKLLAHSAMLEKKNVTWFPSYGAEIRGGTAHCSVIISEEMIGSPIIHHPNMLLIMNNASLNKFESLLKPAGTLVMNSSLIKTSSSRSDINTVSIKATEIAEEVGNSQVANMVMLGALIAKTKIVNPDTVCTALTEIIPARRKRLIHLNKKGFERGLEDIEN